MFYCPRCEGSLEIFENKEMIKLRVENTKLQQEINSLNMHILHLAEKRDKNETRRNVKENF